MQINYTSLNRLRYFSKCAVYYDYRYRDQVPFNEPVKASTLLGLLFHKLTEIYLNPKFELMGEDKKYCLPLALEDWFVDCLNTEVEDINIESLSNELARYSEILTRATIRGSEPLIRNKDGSVPGNIEKYPPQDLLRELFETGLDQNKAMWDLFFNERFDFLGQGSLFYLMGMAYSMFTSFYLPEDFSKVVGVEIGVSTDEYNLVKLPGTDVYVRAWIDMKYLTALKTRVLIDYKTGWKKPSEEEVLRFPQLNVYAFLEKCLSGSLPEKIGIYHAPTAQYILVTPDEKIVVQAIRYMAELHNSTESGISVRHHPSEYNSPCRNRDSVSGIETTCPYIDRCWKY